MLSCESSRPFAANLRTPRGDDLKVEGKADPYKDEALKLRLCGNDCVCIHSWLCAIDLGERLIHFAYNAITSGAAIA